MAGVKSGISQKLAEQQWIVFRKESAKESIREKVEDFRSLYSEYGRYRFRIEPCEAGGVVLCPNEMKRADFYNLVGYLRGCDQVMGVVIEKGGKSLYVTPMPDDALEEQLLGCYDDGQLFSLSIPGYIETGKKAVTLTGETGEPLWEDYLLQQFGISGESVAEVILRAEPLPSGDTMRENASGKVTFEEASPNIKAQIASERYWSGRIEGLILFSIPFILGLIPQFFYRSLPRAVTTAGLVLVFFGLVIGAFFWIVPCLHGMYTKKSFLNIKAYAANGTCLNTYSKFQPGFTRVNRRLRAHLKMNYADVTLAGGEVIRQVPYFLPRKASFTAGNPLCLVNFKSAEVTDSRKLYLMEGYQTVSYPDDNSPQGTWQSVGNGCYVQPGKCLRVYRLRTWHSIYIFADVQVDNGHVFSPICVIEYVHRAERNDAWAEPGKPISLRTYDSRSILAGKPIKWTKITCEKQQ